MIGNAGAYFFHLALGRILVPAEYAMLGALLSVYLIMSTPLSALQFTMAKLTATFDNDRDKVSALYNQTTKYINLFGLIAFVFFAISSVFFVDYFHLDGYLGIVILSFSLLFLFHLAWNRGLMQGMFAFSDLSLSLIIEGVAKLLLGVAIGYYLHLANFTIASITLSLLTAFLITIFYIRTNIKPVTVKKIDLKLSKKHIINESLRMFVGTIGILFFISIDVLMANKYLNSYDAGLYTALSTLGKIVYFAPFSIAMAMFPFTSQITDRNKRLALTKNALLMVIAIVGIAVVMYFSFPGLIFSILFGTNFHNPGILLGLVGLAIGIIGIVQLLVNYLLSQKGWGFAFTLLISAVSQVVIYTNFHQDLSTFVSATLMSAVLMLILVSISFWQEISEK